MKCKYCGCTDGNPCHYVIAGRVSACYWIDFDVCSAPACVRADLRLLRMRLRDIPGSEIRRLFGEVS
jgi:hypothetical protein